ncbi:hypothetical protein M514_01905 [Trichuris suis]|uniref:Chitin-binding type-2 domain-containing protein n=1 Tax=Trichuris suis TaxID=68888 RepID=A0A085NTI7_9BILA|nr:hypothetical protein M514_01905 [Trichuris suis]
MQETLLSGILLLINYALLPTFADLSEGPSEDIPICDTREERIQKYNDHEYYICQKMPMAVGQKENYKGIWIHWDCGVEIEFDETVCKPVLDEAVHNPEMQPLMNEMVFCNEDQTWDTSENESAISGPRCAVESASLIAEEDDKKQYYKCQLSKQNTRCGQWHLKFCEGETVFDSSMQTCVPEQKSSKSKISMRMGYMPYGGAYAAAPYAYGYPAVPMMPYAAPAMRPYAYPYYGYMAPGYPYMAGGIPAPYGPMPMRPYYAGYPMGGLNHYYLSMYPWMYPGMPPYGMPPRIIPVGNQGGQQGTGGGGQQPAAGGGSGTGGGGAGGGIPGVNQIPGANKLPGLGGGGGGGIPGINKIPGANKLPGLSGGGGGGGSKLPGLNKIPEIASCHGMMTFHAAANMAKHALMYVRQN